MSHTPTLVLIDEKEPFIYELNASGVNRWSAHIDGGYADDRKTTRDERRQIAEHIVHCVNVHDQLVAALRDMHEVLSDLLADPHAEMTTQRYAALQAIDKSNQALAAAEKGA